MFARVQARQQMARIDWQALKLTGDEALQMAQLQRDNQFREEVEQLAAKDHGQALKVARYAGEKLGVPPTMFLKKYAKTAD